MTAFSVQVFIRNRTRPVMQKCRYLKLPPERRREAREGKFRVFSCVPSVHYSVPKKRDYPYLPNHKCCCWYCCNIHCYLLLKFWGWGLNRQHSPLLQSEPVNPGQQSFTDVITVLSSVLYSGRYVTLESRMLIYDTYFYNPV